MVRVAREMRLASFGKMSLDRTKVRASASKAMGYGRMREEDERLEAEIEGLPKRVGEADAEKDRRMPLMVGTRKSLDSGSSVPGAWPRCEGTGTWCAWR